jgi:hypothetical protein
MRLCSAARPGASECYTDNFEVGHLKGGAPAIHLPRCTSRSILAHIRLRIGYTNMPVTFPAGNDPTPDSAGACADFLNRHRDL